MEIEPDEMANLLQKVKLDFITTIRNLLTRVFSIHFEQNKNLG